jgi:hypothetical protein
MQVGAGDMVRLYIPADIVTEVAKDIGCGSNGAYVEGAQCSLEHVEPSTDPPA